MFHYILLVRWPMVTLPVVWEYPWLISHCFLFVHLPMESCTAINPYCSAVGLNHVDVFSWSIFVQQPMMTKARPLTPPCSAVVCVEPLWDWSSYLLWGDKDMFEVINCGNDWEESGISKIFTPICSCKGIWNRKKSGDSPEEGEQEHLLPFYLLPFYLPANSCLLLHYSCSGLRELLLRNKVPTRLWATEICHRPWIRLKVVSKFFRSRP